MWNDKRKKWTSQASQKGYIGPTVCEVFANLKSEPQNSSKFQSAYKKVKRII